LLKFKNLVSYRFLNNIARCYLDSIKIIMQNANWLLLECQNFLQHYLSCLRFLCNYFEGPTKLFSDWYLAKFLDTSPNSFFPLYQLPIQIIDKKRSGKRFLTSF